MRAIANVAKDSLVPEKPEQRMVADALVGTDILRESKAVVRRQASEPPEEPAELQAGDHKVVDAQILGDVRQRSPGLDQLQDPVQLVFSKLSVPATMLMGQPRLEMIRIHAEPVAAAVM